MRDSQDFLAVTTTRSIGTGVGPCLAVSYHLHLCRQDYGPRRNAKNFCFLVSWPSPHNIHITIFSFNFAFENWRGYNSAENPRPRVQRAFPGSNFSQS